MLTMSDPQSVDKPSVNHLLQAARWAESRGGATKFFKARTVFLQSCKSKVLQAFSVPCLKSFVGLHVP